VQPDLVRAGTLVAARLIKFKSSDDRHTADGRERPFMADFVEKLEGLA
jgi:hypothetical protein